jgi:hypothetical protein
VSFHVAFAIRRAFSIRKKPNPFSVHIVYQPFVARLSGLRAKNRRSRMLPKPFGEVLRVTTPRRAACSPSIRSPSWQSASLPQF